MRRAQLIAIAVGAILGAVALMLVGRREQALQAQLREQQRRAAASAETSEAVVVATADIPEGTRLSPELLTAQSVPTKFIQPYAVTNPDRAVGQQTAAPIAKGEQVLATKLMRPGSSGALAAKTPDGKRAVTLGLDPLSAVGGFVRPGDHVDLLWTVALPVAQGAPPQPLTITLFQDVLVLAVGGEMVDGGGRRQRASSDKEEPKVAVLTLALTPQEAGLVLFAREQGKLQLSLRPRADASTVALPPASLETLFQAIMPQQSQQAQGGQPPPPRQVEIYRGLEKQTVQVPPSK